MKIYTRSGDKGNTSLFDNSRVPKDSTRVESYGTLDELNSQLGMARSMLKNKEIAGTIKKIQRQLFNVAGELATPDSDEFPERVEQADIEGLEEIIDGLLEKMNKEQLNKFIIPGSNRCSAALHVARTICRRAERRIISLAREEDIREEVLKYVNRLSDVIYSLARYVESELDYVDFKKE
jgi:cob(I)alamin adenosyltransferase